MKRTTFYPALETSMDRFEFLRLAAAGGLSTLGIAPWTSARAQAFPTGPVTLICPYAPGTGIDVVMRILAEKLSEHWGAPVVVKNMPGVSGNLGAAAGAAAKPDGSTLVMIANSHFINQQIGANVVDANTALTPVAPGAVVPYMLAVSAAIPVHTVQELAAYARARPGEVHYSGLHASVPHLLGVAFSSAAKVDVRLVAYKSTTDAIADTVSGRVPIWFTTVPSGIPLVQAGKVRALAVSGDKRLRQLPDVPTMTEAGFPVMNIGSTQYLMAPAGTPAALIERLNRDVTAIMSRRDVAEKIREQGAETSTATVQETAESLRTENRRFIELVKASGIKPQ